MAAGLELIVSSLCNATLCDALRPYVLDNHNPLTSDSPLTRKQNETLRLSNELNGRHLRVASYNNYPLSWVERGNNNTLVGGGVAFLILEILRQKFNFTFEVVAPNKNFVVGGSSPEDSLIGLVNSSTVDMAAAFVPQLVKFRRQVVFSYSLDEGTWMMMLKRPKESAAGSGLLAPFDEHVWYLILAAVVSYGPCIALVTRVRARLVRDRERHIAVSPSCWFVYGAFIKQGTTLAPEANTTRVLFATWWLFIILLSAFYTANLTAFLTLSKFTLDIETPRDLHRKNYRWLAPEGGAVEFIVKDPDEDLSYLRRMISTGRAEFRSYLQDADFLPMVARGAVLVKESTAIDHLMYGEYLRRAREGAEEADRCAYVVAPSAFLTLPRAFAFPVGSTLNTLFDPVFTYLLQAGVISFLEHRDLPSTKICPLDLQSKDRRLRNTDLLMTYLIMVAGLAAALAVFIGEIVIKRYVRIKIQDDNLTRRKKGSRKIRFRDPPDHPPPPPYESLFGPGSQYKGSGARRQLVNGREYYVVDTVHGDTRLIPVRTPSAFLYQ